MNKVSIPQLAVFVISLMLRILFELVVFAVMFVIWLGGVAFATIFGAIAYVFHCIKKPS